MTARSLNEERFLLDVALFDRLSSNKGLRGSAAVARELGVSRSTISRMRAGITNPSMALMLRCEQLFGVPSTVLFTRVEES